MNRYREHVLALANELGVNFYEDARAVNAEAGKIFGLPYVLTLPVRDDATYAVALHELGHHAHRHQDTHPWENGMLLHQEAEAWAWALDHAREVTDAWRANALRSLGSYFAVLGPDHPDYGQRTTWILVGNTGLRPTETFWEVWGKVGGYVPTPEELSPAKEAVYA